MNSKSLCFVDMPLAPKPRSQEGLRAAMQVDPANARVTAHLGRRLADQALKQSSDPDEARRARGEADFLTSRAQKLARRRPS